MRHEAGRAGEIWRRIDIEPAVVATIEPLPPIIAQLYGSYMTEMTVSEARDRLADAIDQARTSHEPVVLTRRGKRVAVLVDADDYARMSDLAEDALDRAELDAARADNDYVPWDQVKADLGLV